MTLLYTFLLVWLLCVIASQALYVSIGRFTLHRFDWSSTKTNLLELSPLAILVCVAAVAGIIRSACFRILDVCHNVVFAAEIREAEGRAAAGLVEIFGRYHVSDDDFDSDLDYARPTKHPLN